MSRRDDITGRKPLKGWNSSHANNKTKRKFDLNLQRKNFFLEEEGRWITLKVTTKTLRTINKNGLYAVLKKAAERGTLNNN
jgi:large subunit ribosomal protein L28